jgi:hypothetical protein
MLVLPGGLFVRLKPLPALVLCGLLPWLGCVSRTTPLPPPEVSTVTFPDSAGIVTVTGLALEGASIAAFNNRTLEGVISSSAKDGCTGTCPFEIKLAADGGDDLRVWQFFETEGSLDVPVPK